MEKMKSVVSKNFEQNVQEFYKQLLINTNFSDVTIASNDNVQFKAHKLVLSSCSEFFQNILLKNPHKNPLLYLNNVSSTEMRAIMEFMYLGECKVGQDAIGRFLKVGEELKIMGIQYDLSKESKDIKEVDLNQIEVFLRKPKKEESDNTETEVMNKTDQDNESVDWWSISISDPLENSESKIDKIPEIDLPDDLSDTLKAKPFSCDICLEKFAYCRSLKKHKRLTGHGTNLKCDVCHFKASKKSQIIKHWQEEHIGNKATYQCSSCNKKFPKYSALTKHKKYMHGKVEISCDQCNYKAPKQGILNQHIAIKHDGIRVVCDLCDTSFVSLANLRVHKKNIHDGIRYPCDKCDYSATQSQGLRSHQKIQHQGLRFECDQCEFKATGKSNLQVHKETKHENKKYKCDQCDFNANHPSSLYSHVKNMHEEHANVPKKCDVCPKEYTGYDGQQKLQRHKDAIHNGVRFECDQCDHVAIYSHGLVKHKSLKHK